MGQIAMLNWENPRAFSKSDYGLENALAKWVRNRWPDKTVQHVAGHFRSLTEAEALKVVYGTASKNTLNRLLHDKNGGPGLFVQLVLDATGCTLEQYIAEQARKAEHERARWEAEERKLAVLQARVAGRYRLDGGADQPPRPGGSVDETLGAGENGPAVAEPRAFAPEPGERR